MASTIKKVKPIIPLSVKGGVIRVIDQATGDIARTTSGWIEDEKYKVFFASDTSGSGNDYGVFDSANPRTGRLVVKFGNSATNGRCHIDSCEGTSATIPALYSRDIIKIKPSTAYKITFYSKTVNRTSGSILQVMEYTGLSRTGNTGYVTISGTTDWTKREVTFTSGATTDGLVLRFQNATGAIEENYIDWNSISLEEVSTINNTSSVPSLYYPKATAVTSNDNIDQSLDTSGAYANTYTPPTAINEGVTHRQTFTPTKKYNYSTKVWVVSKGTGDFTLTVHNSANEEVATATITNANLTNGALNEFIDAWTWASGSYHFHITSTIADGTIKTNTANDLEACSFATIYSKNTTNFTVRTDTQEVSVTAPTVDGWADGTVIDTSDGTYGITPLTLAPGVNNIYYSSNGYNLASSDTDESLQATIGGNIGDGTSQQEVLKGILLCSGSTPSILTIKDRITGNIVLIVRQLANKSLHIPFCENGILFLQGFSANIEGTGAEAYFEIG